jgi:heptosyltransferase-3
MHGGPPDSIDLNALGRVLVVKLRHHGDVLLASPVFTVLKNHAPQAELDALVYADTREMLSLHPAISQLHAVDRKWKSAGMLSRVASEASLYSALRARRYDLLVHLSDHMRGAWLARMLGCRHSVAPARAAGHAGGRGFWKRSFTHRYPLVARRHAVELNLDALRRLGIQPAGPERKLVLVPGAQAEAGVAQLLGSTGIPDKGFIHFHPASRWRFKCWTVERTAELIDRLHANGERVVLTAAPDPGELDLAAAIRDRCASAPADLAGKLSLKMLAALAGRAKLFIGVDSAPMHIAAAMGTPVVALFGPSGEAEWGPWGVPHRVVSSDAHPCRPCGQDGCGGGKVSECLTSIPAEAVLEAVRALPGR